ncbi:EI24 domain-containing protein [Cupriavidus sp. CP313]
MNDIFRSFGRALVSQLHPRMLMLTVLPFVLATLLWGGLLWWGWDPIMGATRSFLETSILTSWIYSALDWFGLQSMRTIVAPLFVAALAIPLVIASMLMFIGVFSVPAVVRHLERNYPDLAKAHGGSILGSVFQSLGSTLVFLVLVLVTLPLWLIPPFFALIPPVLWGWLTYRVMTYDALADHASAEERKTLVRRHRTPLLVIGVAVGLLGSAPTLLWVSSAAVIFLFPFVLAGTLWLYVLIFIFSALWFGHFCLRALAQLRAERAAVPAQPPAHQPDKPALDGDVIDLAPTDVRRIENS